MIKKLKKKHKNYIYFINNTLDSEGIDIYFSSFKKNYFYQFKCNEIKKEEIEKFKKNSEKYFSKNKKNICILITKKEKIII